MKRKFLGTLTMLILVIAGALSPVAGFFVTEMRPQTAFAQATGTTGGTTGTTGSTTGTTGATGTGTGTTDTTGANGTAQIDNKKTDQAQGLDCGLNPLCGLVMFYSTITLFLPNLLATVGGVFLDYTLWSTLQSSTYTAQDGADSFVVKGWKLVRDFSNLLFIFALFVVAFSLILNGDAEGKGFLGLEPKRTIVRVIIVALLVNFSFFMCRAIIDVTNVFGNVFYSKIGSVNVGDLDKVNQSTATSESNKSTADAMGDVSKFYDDTTIFGIKSVSLPILDNVNPQNLIFNGTKDKPDGTWTSYFGFPSYDLGLYILIIFISTLSGFFNLFLLYIFVSSAIFLIARTIGLFFLIILSPLAFVSTTIPSLQSKEYFGFDDWFKQLTGLAFSAPIFVFFLYLTVIFLKVPVLSINDHGYLIKAISIIIKLALTGSVLVFGKKIAVDLSGKLGAMAGNAITQVSKAVAIGAVTGGAAYAAGGASGVLQMGRRLASAKMDSVAESAGRSVLGNERIDALLGKNGNPRRFDSVKNFNLKAIKDVALAGTEPGFAGDLGAAFKYGKLGNRKADMEGAKKAAERAKKAKEASDKEKAKDVDKELENLEKEKKDNLITAKVYNERKVELANKKKALLDPVAAKSKEAKELQKQIDEKEKSNKEAKVPEKLTAANEKLARTEEALARNASTIAVATDQMNRALTDRTAAEVEKARNEQLLADQTGPQNAHLQDLQGQLDNRIRLRDAADAELRENDRALAEIPSGGLSDNPANELARKNLATARNAITQRRNDAAAGVQELQSEITQERTAYATANQPLVAAIAAAEGDRVRHDGLAAAAQTAVTNATTDSARLETEKTATTAERTALQEKVGALEVLTAKKEAADRAKELGSLDKELARRGVSTKDVRGSDGEISHQVTEYTNKADSRNAEQNKAVIDEINARKEVIQNMSTEDKLKDIFANTTNVDQLEGGDVNYARRVLEKYKDADPTPRTSRRFSDDSMN